MSARASNDRLRGTPRAQANSLRRPRFLIASRAIPLLVVGILFVMTAAIVDLMPAPVLRAWLCPVHHASTIRQACDSHQVDPYLACAVIKCESNWDEDAASSAGAVGLMQVMPSTAEYLANIGDVDDESYPTERLSDPDVNIEYGVALLGRLGKSLDSRDAVIAAYNAGLGQASSWASKADSISDAIDFPETSAYLTRVNQYYDFYARLYPEGISE